MHRVVVTIALSLLVVLSGCTGNKKDLPTNVMYIRDINNKTTKSIPIYKSNNPEIQWFIDESMFMFVDYDTNKPTFNGKVRIINTQSLKADYDLSTLEGIAAAYWVNRNKIAVHKLPKNIEEFNIYDIVTREITRIEQKEQSKYIKEARDNFEHEYISNELRMEYAKKLNEEMTFAFTSRDKKRLLYTTKEFSTYMYDVENDKKSFLFKGLRLEWSPDEKKIKYCAPKSGFDGFRQHANYSGKLFKTYVYDLEKNQQEEISDFYVQNSYFSYYGQYIIFYEDNYNELGEI